tara:strand:+ start:433 stop:720 length:288 start_codon:yes stop_codon:yes gene_type:complete
MHLKLTCQRQSKLAHGSNNVAVMAHCPDVADCTHDGHCQATICITAWCEILCLSSPLRNVDSYRVLIWLDPTFTAYLNSPYESPLLIAAINYLYK